MMSIDPLDYCIIMIVLLDCFDVGNKDLLLG